MLGGGGGGGYGGAGSSGDNGNNGQGGKAVIGTGQNKASNGTSGTTGTGGGAGAGGAGGAGGGTGTNPNQLVTGIDGDGATRTTTSSGLGSSLRIVWDTINIMGGAGGLNGADGSGGSGGAGGLGGKAAYTHTGNMRVNQTTNLASGAGNGGGSDNAFMSVSGYLTAVGAVDLKSGDSDSTGTSGNTFIIVGGELDAQDTVSLTAGTASDAGSTGDVELQVDGAQARIHKDLTMIGGRATDSGDGGNVRLMAFDAKVLLQGDTNVTAGAGTTSDGRGGNAVIDANSIEMQNYTYNFTTGANTLGGEVQIYVEDEIASTQGTSTINFIKTSNGGEFLADIGAIEARDGNLLLNLNRTSAETGAGMTDGVLIYDTNIYGNHSLTIRTTNSGDAAFEGDLNIYAWSFNQFNAGWEKATLDSDLASAVDYTGRGMNFYAPTTASANAVLLDNKGLPIQIDDPTLVDVKILGDWSDFSLNIGDHYVLAEGINDNSASGFTQTGVVARELGTFDVLFDIEAQGTQLWGTYSALDLNRGAAHNYLQGYSAGLLNTTSGGDLIVSTIRNPMIVRGQKEEQNEYLIYFQTKGQTMEYETGSHVEIDSFHLLAGPGIRFANSMGTSSLGAFFEAGWGTYDTYNSFAGVDHRGKGDTEYMGGGLMFQHDFNNGVYAEAAARIGQVKTDYQAKNRANVNFDDVDSLYYGGHIGVGYEWAVSDNGTVDFHLRGLWTHMDGEDVYNDSREHLDFDDSDSFRTQLGVDYEHKFNDTFDAFIGAAWEHEFDGEVTATIQNADIDKVEADGSSAIARAGINFHPNEHVSLGLSGFGVVGTKEGGGGELSLSIEF